MIRKHSAKVLSITDANGETHHYTLIGGAWYYSGRTGWYYSGRTGFVLSISEPDGFFRQSVYDLMHCNDKPMRGLSLGRVKRSFPDFLEARIYIREWTSDKESLRTGVPF